MVIAAIEAGIYHDLGSGSNVDVCIIKKGQVTKLRNIRSDNKKVFSSFLDFLKPYRFAEEYLI